MMQMICQRAQRAVHPWAARSLRATFVLGLLASLSLVATPAFAQPCDAAGVFAVRIEMPVRWRANMALAGSEGLARYWALIERMVAEDGTHSEIVTPCGVSQPRTKTLGLYGGEQFGMQYDDAAFGQASATQAVSTARAVGDGVAVSTPKFALLLGLSLPDAGVVRWPAGDALQQSLLRLDGSGIYGAPAHSREDDGMVMPPVDYAGLRRARTFYVASRAVFALEGQSTDCQRFEGTANLAQIAGRAAFNTTLVGCSIHDGGSCSDADLTLANMFQPTIRQSRAGHAVWQRVQGPVQCEQVRELLP